MTRRGNLPGNQAAREHARIQFMLRNRVAFNRVQNINRMRNPIEKSNAITMFVLHARQSLRPHLPIGTHNAWRKLHEAYNIVRNINNRERRQRALDKEKHRPRRVTVNNAARLSLTNNLFTVVVNPGNRNAKVNLVNIKNNIRKYIAGNKTALNKWPFENLIRVKWNTSRTGTNLYRYINGAWYRVNGGTGPVTKNMILENINLGNARL